MRPSAITRKQRGIARCGYLDAPFMQAALRVVERKARALSLLTADDVRAAMAWRDQPRFPQSWAALWVNAARAGLVRRTNHTVESRVASNHRRRLTVWRSLVRRGKA